IKRPVQLTKISKVRDHRSGAIWGCAGERGADGDEGAMGDGLDAAGAIGGTAAAEAAATGSTGASAFVGLAERDVGGGLGVTGSGAAELAMGEGLEAAGAIGGTAAAEAAATGSTGASVFVGLAERDVGGGLGLTALGPAELTFGVEFVAAASSFV